MVLILQDSASVIIINKEGEELLDLPRFIIVSRSRKL